MEELHRQILAVQLIQELIVDMCDERGIFTRVEFESRLQQRVTKLNREIEEINKQMSLKENSKKSKEKTKKESAITNIITPIIGEA
jgi:DNA mismatch repair ATPase MutS